MVVRCKGGACEAGVPKRFGFGLCRTAAAQHAACAAHLLRQMGRQPRLAAQPDEV